MLGADWQNVHARCVQKLGNLTLTGYNSELGARPLETKQTMEGGYRKSKVVWLNEDLERAETWNEERIEARGRRMAERAAQLWPRLSHLAGDPDSLELDPGAGGPILTAGDGWRAWRKRGDASWRVKQNGVRLQQAVAAALLQMDRRGAQNAAKFHPLVLRQEERLHVAIGDGIAGFIYHNMNQAVRREWLEEFADAIETESGTPPIIGSNENRRTLTSGSQPAPVTPVVPPCDPLAARRKKEVEASVNQLETLDLEDSGETLHARRSSRAWRPKGRPWQVSGSATATLASLARWLADQDRRRPAGFYAACPWHFTRGARENAGKAKVVDLASDVMLPYEYLGTYSACRDFAWRMCKQVETQSGETITLGDSVELWMPDAALRRNST